MFKRIFYLLNLISLTVSVSPVDKYLRESHDALSSSENVVIHSLHEIEQIQAHANSPTHSISAFDQESEKHHSKGVIGKKIKKDNKGKTPHQRKMARLLAQGPEKMEQYWAKKRKAYHDKKEKLQLEGEEAVLRAKGEQRERSKRKMQSKSAKEIAEDRKKNALRMRAYREQQNHLKKAKQSAEFHDK